MPSQSSLGNILIVDDDKAITDLLTLNLRSEGYDVETLSRSSEFSLKAFPEVHLVIIDASSQQPSGLEVIEDLRSTASGSRIGIIYYSKNDNERVLIQALDAGADDVLSKPFSLRELMARMRAVMRRRNFAARAVASASETEVARIGDMKIDFIRKSVTVGDEAVNLSNTEYAILALLVRNANTYNSRIEIFRKIWPEGVGANERIVDTNISRLRRKLGKQGECIANRSGLGYIISTEQI